MLIDHRKSSHLHYVRPCPMEVQGRMRRVSKIFAIIRHYPTAHQCVSFQREYAEHKAESQRLSHSLPAHAARLPQVSPGLQLAAEDVADEFRQEILNIRAEPD